MSELYEAFVIILFTARVILYILQGRLVSVLFYVYLITFIAIAALVNTMHICILVNMNQYEYGLYRIWARLGQLTMIMEAQTCHSGPILMQFNFALNIAVCTIKAPYW